jgi:hypothetical protein
VRRKFKTKIDELDYQDRVTFEVTHDRLEKMTKGRIKMQRVRATIGELYNHARRGEVLVTLDRQYPQVVKLDELKAWVLHCRNVGSKTIAIWNGIFSMADEYKKVRKPVVHPWERRKK